VTARHNHAVGLQGRSSSQVPRGYRLRIEINLRSHSLAARRGLLTLDWVAAMWLPKTASLDSAIAVFGQPNGAVLLLAGGAALLSAISAHLTYLRQPLHLARPNS
jgi:hypothetical protein